MSYRKNVAIKVNYVALHRQTGLTDLEMKIYDETGTELGSGLSPITLVAVPSNGGAYYGSFTPDAKGQWRIRIQSATNFDDIQKVFEISNADVDSNEDKIDIIDGNIDQALLDIAAVKGVVDSTEVKVDQTILDVAAVKGVVDSTEGKVDQSLLDIAAVKGVVDNIDLQVNAGGYIL